MLTWMMQRPRPGRLLTSTPMRPRTRTRRTRMLTLPSLLKTMKSVSHALNNTGSRTDQYRVVNEEDAAAAAPEEEDEDDDEEK